MIYLKSRPQEEDDVAYGSGGLVATNRDIPINIFFNLSYLLWFDYNDPHLVKIGNNSYTGYRSTLVPHIMEDEFLSHIPIQIGNHVTIGAGSTILAGVEIDDYAIIGAQSLVRKNTKIGKYEIWGGVPAKKISTRNVK